jgi:hypothetical protein
VDLQLLFPSFWGESEASERLTTHPGMTILSFFRDQCSDV